MVNLREQCQALLAIADPQLKAQGVAALDISGPLDAGLSIPEIAGLPGRMARPELVPHTQIKPGRLNTPEGHAALVHSVVHIEKNAIEMASSFRCVYH